MDRSVGWSAAVARVVRQLAAADAPAAVGLVTEALLELFEADVVALVLPGPGADVLQIADAVGRRAGDVLGVRLPVAGTMAGAAWSSGRPQRVADVRRSSVVPHVGGLDLGPAMAVPMTTARGPRGVLSVARAHDAACFTHDDLDVASTLAGQAALALELADARADTGRIALLEDRDRIARDLHDHVVQRLFATGLGLQAVALRMADGPDRERLHTQVSEIDATIRQIRTSIFALQAPGTDGGATLRARVLALTGNALASVRTRPRVDFHGPVDLVVPARLHADVLAVVREALSNVTRHADASAAEVVVRADLHRLTVVVEDDGRGPAAAGPHSGLANLADRAVAAGGSCTVTAREPRGTTLTWAVPLPEEAP